MKTTSSHLMKGVIIGVILLISAQAWRATQREEVMAPSASASTASAPPAAMPPSPRYQLIIPSENSIEFVEQLKAPHDPWKNRTDPDDVWHSQRQKASELLIRLNLPPLER
ncbi:MAG TPA: hypothetical protein VGE39_16630 [Prosthecobacter sp.]